jgi:ankyrin repeat protein
MIGVVFMVSGIVPTSAWSHNCGMHVIADYLIEKIQQDDFEAIFNTPPYPELLKAFQTIYKQENLTWVQIRQASLEASRTDSQIIWGVALRKMLPDVFRRADEYKINLENQFVALMELVKQGLIEEAEESYPIIFEANRDYLEQQARVAHSSSESETEDLSDSISHYWLEKGYENYCRALLSVNRSDDHFLWLGMDELKVFCEHLRINPKFNNYNPTVEPSKIELIFRNKGDHWEREKPLSITEGLADKYFETTFYKTYLTFNINFLMENSAKIGKVYFSENYFENDLPEEDLIKAQKSPIYNFIKNLDKPGYLTYIKNLSESDKAKLNVIELAVSAFSSDDFIAWFKLIKDNEPIFKKYSEILLEAVKYRKYNTAKKLLNVFPDFFTSLECMPSLIGAIKKNDYIMSHRLLSAQKYKSGNILGNMFKGFSPSPDGTINHSDADGIPALYYAIRNQNLSLVALLLEKGACATYYLGPDQLKSLNIQNINQSWFFSLKLNGYKLALEYENPELCLLLSRTVDVPEINLITNRKGDNIFHICAKKGKIGLSKQLRKIQFNLNTPNKEGKNELHLAAEIGDVEGITFCLNNQLSLLSKDRQGNTALHLASLNGHLEAVRYLFKKMQAFQKALVSHHEVFEINQENKLGLTPLVLADRAEKTKVVAYLQSKGCVDLFIEAIKDINKACESHEPDFRAVFEKHKGLTSLLDEKNDTLLHYVCDTFKGENVKILIKQFADVKFNLNAKNKAGFTPLHLATFKNNINAVNALLAQGAYIDLITPTGLTACHIAALNDQKEIFELLYTKGASLKLEAFPKSIENKGFNWNLKDALTPVKIAEFKQGRVFAYLKEKNLVPKPQEHYHSFTHKMLAKAENGLKLVRLNTNYISSSYGETYELEQTFTFKALTVGKIAVPTVLKAQFGGTAFAFEFAKQVFLYTYPMAAGKTGWIYYGIKPSVHNYAPSYVSTGFDYGSKALSTIIYFPFTVMNAIDLYERPVRRIVGLGTSIGLLKVAKYFKKDNQQLQALAMFTGRELGNGLVDAYHETSPEKKAYKAFMENRVNEPLNQAYEIWTSLIGKERGEALISSVNYAHELRQSLYENVGQIERAFIEKYLKESMLDNWLNSALVTLDSLGMAEYVSNNFMIATVKYYIESFFNWRDDLLSDLEKRIDENVWQDSDYRNIILTYLYKQLKLIHSQKKEELLDQLRKAEELDRKDLVASLELKIKEHDANITKYGDLSKQHYEKTPKGSITLIYSEAKTSENKAWFNQHHLEELQKYNPDYIVDMAEGDLGGDRTHIEMAEYICTAISAQGIEIEGEVLAQFKSELTPDNYKTALSEFWRSQLSEHTEKNTLLFAQELEAKTSELNEVIPKFKELATPEELRVVELDKNPEIRKHEYDLLSENKKSYILTAALISARYRVVINASAERDDANRDVIHAESNLEYTMSDFDQEIERLDKTYNPLRVNYEHNKDKLTPDLVINDLKKIIIEGNEGKDKRDYGTSLLLSCLVKTGLISYDVAVDKYEHKFYESLKVNGNKLENSVNAVFGQAMTEILNNTQVILAQVDHQVLDLNIRLNEDKQRVISVRKILSEKEIAYQQCKTDNLSKLKPEDQAEFKSFFRRLDDITSKLNNYNEALSEKQIADRNYQLGAEQKEEISTLIQVKNIEIMNLDQFMISDNDIWNLANDACKHSSDITEVNKYIINFFVQKGVGTFEQLSAQLWSTLSDGQKSSDDKHLIKHLYKRLRGQVDVINTQLIPNQKVNLKNEVDSLHIQSLKLDPDIDQLQLIQKNVSLRAELAKKQYIEKLPVEQQAEFQSSLDNNFANLHNTINGENIKNVFATVGQGQLALETVNYQSFLSKYGQSPLKNSMTLARKLLDYKYSFLPKPSEAECQEELKSLTSLLHVVEQAKAFESAKETIDYSIATFVYHESNVSGESIPSIFNNILKTNILTDNKNISSITSLDLNQPAPAIKAIQQFIQTEVKGISISKNGEHVIEKVWTPSVPKHHGKWHRATNNVKKIYHENKGLIIAAAAMVAAVIAAKCGQMQVAVKLFAVAGGEAAETKIWGANGDKNAQKTAFQKVQHNHNEGMEAARNELNHNLKIVEGQNQAQWENLHTRADQNSSYLQNQAQVNQVPAASSEPHIPSLANSLYQGGVFGPQPQQTLPGPLLPEHLPDSVKFPSSSQIYIPYGLQETPKEQPTIPMAPPGGQLAVPASAPKAESANMVNGWKEPNGESGIKQQSTPAELDKGPLAFLPSYNKLIYPIEAQQASSTPKKAPVPKIPLGLPVAAPTRKQSAQKMTGPTDKSKTVPKLPPAKKSLPKVQPKVAANDAHLASAASKNEARQLAVQAFEKRRGLADSFLLACGKNDAVVANACINTVYNVIGKENPFLLFPTATSGASSKVGEAIDVATKTNALAFGWSQDAKVSGAQLTFGNQLIFKDLFPLIKTYQEEGFAGIQKLESHLKKEYQYSHNELINAFRQQEILDLKASNFAKKMKLDRNDIRVVSQFFSDPVNREMALGILMDFVYHEQTVVQIMYTKEFTKALTDPLNKVAGSFFRIDGQYINGEEFSFSALKDPSNIQERLNDFFKPIFTKIVSLHSDPVKLDQYYKQMNRQVELSIGKAAPYIGTGADPLTYWQRNANVIYNQQLHSWVRNFLHDLTIPDLEDKKSKKKGI